MKRIAAALFLGSFTSLVAIGQLIDAQSQCLPFGPPPAAGYQPYDEAVNTRAQKVVAGVPAYLWRHGCGPTAAAMVIGYWDGHGFPLLIPGDASTQTSAVNQAIATGDGTGTHYRDYCEPCDNCALDCAIPDTPGCQYGPLLADRSTTGGAHSNNSLADFMRSSWSVASNYYGWSWLSDADDSLSGYTNAFVNNTYGASYIAAAQSVNWDAFTWGEFRAEIDANRPMVFLVDCDGDAESDHFVTAIGYRDTSGYAEYACFDTWGTGVRWERFRGMSSSYSWGIFGATYCEVAQRQGSIAAWGENDLGQCNVPAPNTGMIAVKAGSTHTLGLRADGEVVAWGENGDGECNVPSPNTGFVAIEGGYKHSVGVMANGTIVAWGLNDYGQCTVPSPNATFVAVAAGWRYSLGLKADGSIVAWGHNVYGQCNVPAPTSGFVAVAAGGYHGLALARDGTIAAWGHNGYGQCNIPSPNSGFVAVAAGYRHSLGLKADGSIVTWGDNADTQCNVPSPNADFVAIATGDRHSLALKGDGSIVAWGWNSWGQCNLPAPNGAFVAVAGGWGHSVALGCPSLAAPTLTSPANGASSQPLSGTLYWSDVGGAIGYRVQIGTSCGLGSERDLADAQYSYSDLQPGTVYYWRVKCRNACGSYGDYSSCFSFSTPSPPQERSIVAWGLNDYGQCYVPLPNTGFVAVVGGGMHSLGMQADGSLVAWGSNSYGQCNVPAPNSGFGGVAAGMYHSLGLKSDASIMAWGRNYHGECNVPAPNSDFVAVGAGGYHSLGLKSDGSIVAWGSNDYGQCNVPSSGSVFVAVDGGLFHSLALEADGSIVAWGYNDQGQCNVPTPNTGFASIAGGVLHSLGLRADGSIVAWGHDGYEQCSVPSPNTGFVAVAAGNYHSVALKDDGSMVAWGCGSPYNCGQCNAPSPNAAFVALAAGGYHTLGLKGQPRGDMNCDGTAGYLSFGDINPFVLYLSNFSAWQASYPGCDPLNGDINGDGTYGQLSFGDINPFVMLLTGG